jgi:hypothetical protein
LVLNHGSGNEDVMPYMSSMLGHWIELAWAAGGTVCARPSHATASRTTLKRARVPSAAIVAGVARAA